MDLLNLVIWFIVVGAIFGLLFWVIDYVGMPAPFARVAKIILVIVAVIMLVNLLLGFLPSGSMPKLKLMP